jgi:hypothetical protein
MNGYHLWVWWNTRRDEPALKTVERISFLDLVN